MADMAAAMALERGWQALAGRPQREAADALHDGAVATGDEEAMRRAGVDFETAFLAEMLRHSGLGSLRGLAGGGVAEAQLAPMLARTLAEKLAASGGLGLASLVTASLAARTGGAPAGDEHAAARPAADGAHPDAPPAAGR